MTTKFSKLDSEAKMEVHAFVMPDLSGEESETFRTPILGTANSFPKAKRTPLPPLPDDQKGRRFHVDPVLKDLLSSDDETETEIDRRVEARVEELRRAAEESAKEKGYEEGYARGKAEAKASYEESARERLDRMDAFLTSMESLKDEIYRANERFLVELVFRVAGNVLQREIESDSEYISRVVRTVVEKVGVKEQLKLIANASQVENLYALLPELEKKHSALKNISIETSSQLGEADVVIETDWNRIDATLESQMGTLHESLLEGLVESQANRESKDDATGDKESA